MKFTPKLASNAFSYIEKVSADALRSENKTRGVRFVLYGLIDKETSEINQFILIMRIGSSRVAKRIRYRLKNNFEKNFGVKLSYYDDFPYGAFGELSMIEYTGKSTFSTVMSASILWIKVPEFKKAYLCQVYDHSPELTKYLITPRQHIPVNDPPIIGSVEERYCYLLGLDGPNYKTPFNTCKREWECFCKVYNIMWGHYPPATSDITLLNYGEVTIEE